MASNGVTNGVDNVTANGSLADSNPTAELVNAEMQASTISADEIALYDRQIRLWGVQAQQKIQNANILIITIKGLGNEIAKNLVLAGIKTLTVLDHELVTEEDLGAQFLISEEDIGKNRAEAAAPQLRKLNPRVGVFTDTDMAGVKPPDYFAAYDIVIATDLLFPILTPISDAVRFSNVRFFAAGVYGMYGYIFADLIQHDFVVERAKSNVETKIGPETVTRSILKAATKRENGKTLPVESVTKREMYCPLRIANTSPLPSEFTNSARRLKQVSPLLTCTRALWEFENTALRQPTHAKEDLVAFTKIAQATHTTLGLKTETLTSEFLRAFLQNIGSEIVPVTATLGAFVAENVINVLGQREHPIQNLLLFDGEESKAPVYSLYTELPPLIPSTDGLQAGVSTLPILQQGGLAMPDATVV